MRRVVWESAVVLFLMLVLGTASNLLPSRHLAWWGRGQEPPRAGQDFQLLDVDSAHALWESLPGTVFVDTRTQQEYAAGHVPQALRLELPSLDHMLDNATRQRLGGAAAVVIYGSSEETDIEQLLAQALRQRIPEMPLPYVLLGGFAHWQGAGFPTEQGP